MLSGWIGSTASAGLPTMAKRPGLRRFTLDAAKAQAVLAEAGVRQSSGVPVAAFGYMDDQKRPRRIVARYADGWRADLRFHIDGTYSLTQSLRLRSVAIQPEAANV
jgi:hypothetical protein